MGIWILVMLLIHGCNRIGLRKWIPVCMVELNEVLFVSSHGTFSDMAVMERSESRELLR